MTPHHARTNWCSFRYSYIYTYIWVPEHSPPTHHTPSPLHTITTTHYTHYISLTVVQLHLLHTSFFSISVTTIHCSPLSVLLCTLPICFFRQAIQKIVPSPLLFFILNLRIVFFLFCFFQSNYYTYKIVHIAHWTTPWPVNGRGTPHLPPPLPGSSIFYSIWLSSRFSFLYSNFQVFSFF